MYREDQRRCPQCQRSMSEVSLPEGKAHHVAEVDLCHDCGGLFFEFFDGEPASLSRRALSQGVGSAGQGDHAIREGLTCPDCRRPMQVATYLDLADSAQIGRCGGCFSVFVPHSELSVLARFQYDAALVENARANARECILDAVPAEGASDVVKGEMEDAERYFGRIRMLARLGTFLESLFRLEGLD